MSLCTVCLVNSLYFICQMLTLLEDVICRSIESKILQAMPIILSHAPPMCDKCGGLNVHMQPWSDRNCFTAFSSTLEVICKSLQAPVKLVPLSERICFTGPRIARNLLKWNWRFPGTQSLIYEWLWCLDMWIALPIVCFLHSRLLSYKQILTRGQTHPLPHV